MFPHLLLPFLLVSSVAQHPNRREGKETAKTCTRWRGTASGNDRSVQFDVTLCEADGSVTGTLEWRSDRSGTSTRTLEGSRSGDVLVLRDVTLDGKPNAGWRFCKIDAYRLTRSGADALAGSYQSNACHDHATLELARVH